MATLAEGATKAADFVTNKKAKGGIRMPALSLTKVGVGAAFVSATLSGLVAIIGPLNNANAAVISGAFHIAGLAIAIGGAIAAVDIIVRGAVTVLKPDAPSPPEDGT
jgi:hypothetical protein